ncbi:MAG: sigma 54-interacting transcriptional regulator [Peptococcaceae bacterium]|nr:sigma 54-interacting transcriptional regulator [Peptococcaceae bacterium]
MSISLQEVKTIWKNLRTSQNKTDNPYISDIIKASWERSSAYGISPFLKEAPIVISVKELEQRKKNNRELIKNSLTIMKKLYKFVAGTGFVVALADKEGVILEIIGDEKAIEFTKPGNFMQGANWSEQVVGTNAIGLALEIKKPVRVVGYEHYSLCSLKGSCYASPIFDPEGSIMGVLDLTGPHEYGNIHTLGMVVAACNAIEKQILLQRAYSASELSDLLKDVLMESMPDGVLAIDKSGKVTHLNSAAGRLLKLDPNNSIGQNISALLKSHAQNNSYFIDIMMRGLNENDDIITVDLGEENIKVFASCRPLIRSDGNRCGTVALLRENRRVARMVTQMMGARAKFSFDKILGNNSQFRQVVEVCKTAASFHSNILLLGESGTGKEIFAQSIHNASPRKLQPFVALNCAAIPRELIASELFGYEEGAFTGARKGGNPGKFELADQGTLFLDEIGEMPLDLQSSLLRVLEDRTVMRLGGREPIPVNVRIIAATNKNLKQEMENGNFRSDLYYRLNVITVEIPPLRERPDDVEVLSQSFLSTISGRLGKTVEGFDSEVINIFKDYNWPGNVRELRNVIERAVHTAQDKIITLKDIPTEIIAYRSNNCVDSKDNKDSGKEKREKRSLKVIEEKLIRDYLKKYRSKKRVAEELGIARSTLYRKFEEYGIEPREH